MRVHGSNYDKLAENKGNGPVVCLMSRNEDGGWNELQVRSGPGSYRTDGKWEKVCRWGKEVKLRAFGGQLEDGRSGK